MLFLVGDDNPFVAGIACCAIVIAHVASKPGLFVTPVDVVIRLPRVLASACEAKSPEAHRFERDGSRQNQEIGP